MALSQRLSRPSAGLKYGSVAGSVGLAGYVMASSNYLLFHTLAEGFAVVVAILIYVVGTRTHRLSGDHFLLFLGHSYLFVAVIDIFHTMTYQGMGIFPGYTANTPTQLWIAGRYLDAGSLLLATLFIGRGFDSRLVVSGYTLVTGSLLLSIMVLGNFPTALVPGQGLTTFKVVSEYVVCLLLVGAGLRLRARGSKLDPRMYRLMIASLGITVLAELSFTLYTDVYGLMNLVGHLLKLLAYYLVFLGIVQRGLEYPYAVIHDLNQSLEDRVAERTRQLDLLNRDLKQEMADREQAEEGLRASEERFRAAFNQAAMGIALVGLDGRWTRVNDRLSQILGYTTEELYGLSYQDVTHPDDLQQYNAQVARLVSGSSDSYSAEKRYLRKDGSMGWATLSVAPLRGTGGGITGYIVAVEDITKRKDADRFREEYVSMVSHDLRSPLTVIQGQTQMLDRFAEEPIVVRKSAEAIYTSSNRMNAMIRDLVESARLESGQATLNRVLMDLRPFVANLMERLNMGVGRERIKMEMNEHLPRIQADPVYLERIVTNLLTNATKYSAPESDVTVTLRATRDEVVVTVEDRGVGIAREEIGQIFDRFYRARSGGKAEGLGLGLYITRQLVLAHGGRIWVESEEGQGSRFCFTLPAAQTASPGAGPATSG